MKTVCLSSRLRCTCWSSQHYHTSRRPYYCTSYSHHGTAKYTDSYHLPPNTPYPFLINNNRYLYLVKASALESRWGTVGGLLEEIATSFRVPQRE